MGMAWGCEWFSQIQRAARDQFGWDIMKLMESEASIKIIKISPDTDPKPIRTFSVSCSATSTAYFVMKLANFEVPRVPRVTVYWPIYLQCGKARTKSLARWIANEKCQTWSKSWEFMETWEAGSCCAPKRMGSQFWSWGDVPWRGPASPLNGNPAAAGTIWYPLVN